MLSGFKRVGEARDRKKYGNTVGITGSNGAARNLRSLPDMPSLKLTRGAVPFLVHARDLVLQFFLQLVDCSFPAWAISAHGLDRLPAMSKTTLVRRTSEAFEVAPSRHPLVVGHMYKENKTHTMFNKRYFALYNGGLLVYYKHERDFKKDVKKHEGVVSWRPIWLAALHQRQYFAPL